MLLSAWVLSTGLIGALINQLPMSLNRDAQPQSLNHYDSQFASEKLMAL